MAAILYRAHNNIALLLLVQRSGKETASQCNGNRNFERQYNAAIDIFGSFCQHFCLEIINLICMKSKEWPGYKQGTEYISTGTFLWKQVTFKILAHFT